MGRKNLSFVREPDEPDEEVYQVLGMNRAQIGTIYKGDWGWTFETTYDCWLTSDCLRRIADFLDTLPGERSDTPCLEKTKASQ